MQNEGSEFLMGKNDTDDCDVVNDTGLYPQPDAAPQISLPSVLDEFDKEDLKALQNATEDREKFLNWGLWATSICIGVSILVVVALFWFKTYTQLGSVLIAFISGLAVEVVGIAAVMAKYLFPGNGPQRHNKVSTTIDQASSL
ncbi:hypothetical protein [Bifidobacterium sp. ESL0800]|uniref:hypothetical protein n=1 Tax=Bifidobacterium sp. ESL0800 TaxID=2983236 RepID=UPI0023F90259|nr:hypothetical protein [Bifidobacterium sp. ESL0800]WEV75641.1 hypothetical protein OZX75_08535 [Bifidobacterium sp. ESL0800]